MLTGKTPSGFEFALEDGVLDNMELVDTLAEMQGDNPLQLSGVCKMVLGTEQRERLYNHLRDEHGRVPVTAVTSEINAIFEELGKKAKN